MKNREAQIDAALRELYARLVRGTATDADKAAITALQIERGERLKRAALSAVH